MESFHRLTGAQVVSAPSFRENLLSFGVVVRAGLAGAGQGRRAHEPAAQGNHAGPADRSQKALGGGRGRRAPVGLSVSFAAYSLALGRVDEGHWKEAEMQGQSTQEHGRTFQGRLRSGPQRIQRRPIRSGSTWWATSKDASAGWSCSRPSTIACRAIRPGRPTSVLPSDAERITESKELHVTSLDCQWMEDVSPWYGLVKPYEEKAPEAANPTTGGPAAAAPGARRGSAGWSSRRSRRGSASRFACRPCAAPPAGAPTTPIVPAVPLPPPTGSGWIIRIRGHHFHNAERIDAVRGAEYVRQTLIRNLLTGKVKLAADSKGNVEEVTTQELGIRCPVLVKPSMPYAVDLPRPAAQTGSGSRPADAPARPGGAAAAAQPAPAKADETPQTVKVNQCRL